MNESGCPRLRCYRAWAEIDLGAIAFNVKQLKRLVGDNTEIMAVVKADGYGHGAEQVSKTALASGATWLGVATTDEGIALRKCGIHDPILILAPIPVERIQDAVCHDLRLTVCTVDMLQAISHATEVAGKTQARVHLKIDTGMGRIGIEPGEVLPFVNSAAMYPNVRVEGIFTHFATADEVDKSFAIQQFERFRNAEKDLTKAGLSSCICHVSNSAAILDHPMFSLDLVRAGIIIYGLYPSSEVKHEIALRPSLEFKTRIIHVKRVSKGVSISYGATYATDEPCTIATLAVGYADGFSRALSNKGVVLIGGKRLPVVGRVCMDQCMIKAPVDSDIAIGDEVVLIGRQGDEEISVDEVAALMGTINYEVVCMITGRVPRVYKNGSA
jgi:alanine racemase